MDGPRRWDECGWIVDLGSQLVFRRYFLQDAKNSNAMEVINHRLMGI